jgi:hypothetical protein
MYIPPAPRWSEGSWTVECIVQHGFFVFTVYYSLQKAWIKDNITQVTESSCLDEFPEHFNIYSSWFVHVIQLITIVCVSSIVDCCMYCLSPKSEEMIHGRGRRIPAEGGPCHRQPPPPPLVPPIITRRALEHTKYHAQMRKQLPTPTLGEHDGLISVESRCLRQCV